MNRRDFTRKAPGRVIKTPSGYLAFVPDPLPPQINWSDRLLVILSQADRSLAKLAEVGKAFPVSHAVVRPFIRNEAVLSSRIEGTKTTLRELYSLEAQQLSFFENPDAQEVRNYVIALDYGLERLDTLPDSQRLMKEIHSRLMQGVRGERSTPGELRRSQNWIGPPGVTIETAPYVPPPVDEMKTSLSDLEIYINNPSDLPPLVQIGLIHYQFEAIHPFLDGNGRVGRLLVSLLLSAWGLLPQPLLYLSAHFEANRQEYYNKLLAVTQQGAWEEWLGFFLRGVDQQGKDSVTRLQRIKNIRDRYIKEIAMERTRETLVKAIDFLIGQPVINVSNLQEGIRLNNYVTAQRYIDRLIKHGILRQLEGRARNRIFIADEILNAIEID